MNLNKVMLIGRLGQDPELKTTPQGNAVTSLNIATNESFTKKDGTKEEHTSWHKVTVWGKTAENVCKFCKKGRQLYIEGRIQYRSYERDGNKFTAVEIVANTVQFLGDAERPVDAAMSKIMSSQSQSNQKDNFDINDIPF